MQSGGNATDVQNNRVLDVPTIAAIGAITGLLMLVTHEVLGHSVTTVLLGAHLVRITAIDSSYAGPASPTAMRTIAAAGIVANILAGCAVLSAARCIPAGWFHTRFFAWLFGHATLFMGSSYLAGFALLPFGDVRAAIDGLPLRLPFEFALLATGVAIYAATVRDAARTLGRWLGSGNSRGASTVTLTPYLAIGTAILAAGLLHPGAPFSGALWAAAAGFGANAGLLFAADSLRKAGSAAAEPFYIERSWAWIEAGLTATLALVLLLGPGIPR